MRLYTYRFREPECYISLYRLSLMLQNIFFENTNGKWSLLGIQLYVDKAIRIYSRCLISNWHHLYKTYMFFRLFHRFSSGIYFSSFISAIYRYIRTIVYLYFNIIIIIIKYCDTRAFYMQNIWCNIFVCASSYAFHGEKRIFWSFA